MRLRGELFVWLQDLGILEPSDALELTKRAAELKPEVSALFLNGLLVYDLFEALKLVSKPALLRDSSTPLAKLNNWNTLAPMFESVGAAIDADAKVRAARTCPSTPAATCAEEARRVHTHVRRF